MNTVLDFAPSASVTTQKIIIRPCFSCGRLDAVPAGSPTRACAECRTEAIPAELLDRCGSDAAFRVQFLLGRRAKKGVVA
jgi:hypothetical protein